MNRTKRPKPPGNDRQIVRRAASPLRPGASPCRRRVQATFAGGCFWCMEPAFETLPGVIDVTAGYTGGTTEAPTYEEVCSGATGHLEAVQVTFDPDLTGYEELLRVFWRQIDPTDAGGQFADRGTQYATAIFYHSDEQRKTAEESRDALDESGVFSRPLVTPIRPAGRFFPAEDRHQDYHIRCPLQHRAYREASGRDTFLRRHWNDRKQRRSKELPVPSDEDLRALLTPLQFEVTRRNGTEPPFRNEYWDNHRDGIYVDVISGEPLFGSRDKYDSGTGWPSFTRPLLDDAVFEREDRSHGMIRRDVRSRSSDAHLGHVFPDGPAPAGLRYCINSAALRFIPREKLAEEGYGDYRELFGAERTSR